MTATGRHAADNEPADLVPDPDRSPGTCSVCPHPWADHDQLGIRYCSATMASAQTRGCICRPVVPVRSARA